MSSETSEGSPARADRVKRESLLGGSGSGLANAPDRSRSRVTCYNSFFFLNFEALSYFDIRIKNIPIIEQDRLNFLGSAFKPSNLTIARNGQLEEMVD